LHPEKGIYTILEMMHKYEMRIIDVDMTIVMAGQHVEEGKTIARMLSSYPHAKLIDPMKDVASMAGLLARTDVLLMPSVFEEPFGMLSVEAQHSGCRVIASSLGGLSETNCGLLTLVEQRNPMALISGIKAAKSLGTVSRKERDQAVESFTLSKSVRDLLSIIHA
jgi:D-inositol-3-phosphate glycosyltransferase